MAWGHIKHRKKKALIRISKTTILVQKPSTYYAQERRTSPSIRATGEN